MEGSCAQHYSTSTPVGSVASCSSRSEPGRPPAPPLHRLAGLLPPAACTHRSSNRSSCSPSALQSPPTLALHADRHCHMYHLHTIYSAPLSSSRAKRESELFSSSDGNDGICGSFGILVHAQALHNACQSWQKDPDKPIPPTQAVSCLPPSHPHLPFILTLPLHTFHQPGSTLRFP